MKVVNNDDLTEILLRQFHCQHVHIEQEYGSRFRRFGVAAKRSNYNCLTLKITDSDINGLSQI